MTHLTLEQVRELRAELERQLVKLEKSMAVSEEAAGTVELDQTAVGRLSRMDSLMSQGMARNLQERERVKLARIQEAFRRLDEGDYGVCTRCDAPIPFGRLVVFPEAPTCQGCGEG